MTIEELREQIAEKQYQMNCLKCEINRIKRRFCRENAPFKIGDKIKFGNKIGYITDVTLNNSENDFDYLWKPMKKDGSLYVRSKRIYSLEAGSIELIEHRQ